MKQGKNLWWGDILIFAVLTGIGFKRLLKLLKNLNCKTGDFLTAKIEQCHSFKTNRSLKVE